MGHPTNRRRIASPLQASLRCSVPLAVLGLVLLAGRDVSAQPVKASAEGAAFFESRIRPLLLARCESCHGAEKQKGGLRLDRREDLLKGGDTGAAIVPFRPDESELIRAVNYLDDLKMPPKGKLPQNEIAALRQWIQQGAPWPETTSPISPSSGVRTTAPAGVARSPAEDRDFWAFQTPVERTLPTVKRTDWPRTEIDAFVLSRLESRGLAPAPAADRRTLIRRATFDLIGLPPTTEEIAAFLEDGSPDAYPKLIDRLLASPHYGERWGRHWLDVARYADSNGMDENLAFANAWRYRDYVVAAFNRDLPYDQFVREQLAGDLMSGSDGTGQFFDRLAATGFLVLGPKMLAEDDPVKMEMDIIDEQVDSVGKAFLGMTLGCARCHDHKFDPIPTADYYGLAGIFKSTQTMEHFRVVARWNERPLANAAEAAQHHRLNDRIQQTKAKIDQTIARANEALLAELGKRNANGKSAPGLPDKPEEHYPESVRASLKTLREDFARFEAESAKVPTVMAVSERKAADLPIHIRGNHLTLGAAVPRGFPSVLRGKQPPPIGPDRSGRLELADWLTRPDNPLTARVIVNRLWLWHFGEGLVRSVDNFGRLGEAPTHPELLDWLALRLVADGWSLKSLQRRIMLSASYQMSTAPNPAAEAMDPENRLLWHRSRGRLEAEAIRDAILLVSGQLARTMKGSLLNTPNRAYVTGTASTNSTTYQSQRRSIYLPVVRSALYDLFQAFDFADPSAGSGRRDATTVAPQALCMLNSELVLKASESLADLLLAGNLKDDEARLNWVYERTLGRPPTSAETARAITFMGEYQRVLESQGEPATNVERHRVAWQGFCRVLIQSSEAMFVD